MTDAHEEGPADATGVAVRPDTDGRTIAPYGSWASPITSALLAAGAKPIEGAAVDGDAVYWLEGVFGEGGRLALLRSVGRGPAEVLIPAPYNVRTRVHEYGGGAWIVDAGVVFFSNFADNLVYRRDADGRIAALTPDTRARHADFAIDRARRRLICVREAHGGAAEPRNSLVAIPIDREGDADDDADELAGGRDFYAAPRLSGDGRRLAWICWNHPQMPWDGTELWSADVGDDGSLYDARRIAGGPDESLTQPIWSPSGALFVVSDRSGWWNIHRVDGDRLVNVLPMEAEFAAPAWSFGQASYGFVDPTTIVASCIDEGRYRLLRIATDTATWTEIPTAFAVFDALRPSRGSVLALVSSETIPTGLVEIDLATGHHHTFATSIDRLPDPRYLSQPRRIRFPGHGGRTVHAIHYPPRNGDHAGPAGERPPLIVQGHGGPTSMTNVGLRLGNHYWTSRGFAVLDVDYVGSSGYGRAFRQALRGRWGVDDVDDFVAAACHLADAGLVDRERMAIRGGSASGYSALAALTFRDVFRAGVSYYGVSDLATMFRDTHKFESRYGDWLVGSLAEHPERVAERSPLSHADRITAPMLFLQGLDDRVVPPSQSEVIVDSLRSRGVPVAYLAFAGEGHGFRRFETLVRACEAELAFYAGVFGFEPADAVEPLAFEGRATRARHPAAASEGLPS